MKLTTAQLDALYNCFRRFNDGPLASLEAVCNEYLKMIAESHTHCIIAAPEGSQIADNYATQSSAGVYFKPIPKPCPAPVLIPVTVTVESVYRHMPPIPEGYVAEFGDVEKLIEKGFTQFISDGFWIVTISTKSSAGLMRICLKKHEG